MDGTHIELVAGSLEWSGKFLRKRKRLLYAGKHVIATTRHSSLVSNEVIPATSTCSYEFSQQRNGSELVSAAESALQFEAEFGRSE